MQTDAQHVTKYSIQKSLSIMAGSFDIFSIYTGFETLYVVCEFLWGIRNMVEKDGFVPNLYPNG